MQQGKEYLLIIGNNVRKLRNLKGVSQQELADYANVAKSTVQRIENGKLNPSIVLLKNISLALGIDLAELINDKD